jgi:hypothetical protein
MKNLRLTLLALAAVPGLALGAGMKPGNYEYTTKMEMPGMPFAMPAMTMKHCLKQEDIDKNRQYNSEQNKDCEVKNMKQSGSKTTFDLACKDGTKGSAEYNVTDTGMSGKTVMRTGDGEDMTMNMTAKRLGDCK